MALLFTNNASSTLAVVLNAGATSCTVATNEGALFPNPTGGDTFYATLEDAAGNIEIISCSARSSDNFTTIVRAQEGTSDQTWAIGTRIEIRTTAATLTAMLQSSDASGIYAPLSHFNDSSTTAQLLENGAVAAQTNNQGLEVRRAAGQTQTTVEFQNNSGTVLGSVYHSPTNDLILSNVTNSGWVKLWGEDSGGTPTSLVEGDPDGPVTTWYNGSQKTETTAYGIEVWGQNAAAPYNAHVSLHNSNGTEVARMGMVPGANEVRLESSSNGFPFRLYGKDAGGTNQTVLLGDPDNAVNLYYAGAKKFETATDGVAISGVASQTATPTDNDHLTTKAYVDAQISTQVSDGTGLTDSASQNGYTELPGGYLMQWGLAINPSTNATINFHRSFSAIYNVQVTAAQAIPTGGEDIHTVYSYNVSNFNLRHRDYPTGTDFFWLAIGRF